VLCWTVVQTTVAASSRLQIDYYHYVNSITHVLLTFNSAINFLIYCLIGKKFRRIFVAMICGGRCHGGGGGGGDHTRCRGVGLGVPGVEEVDEVPAAADDGHGMPDPSRHLTS